MTATAEEQLAAIRAELAETRRLLGKHNPLRVPCTYCGAIRSERCRSQTRPGHPAKTHTIRLYLSDQETARGR